MASAAEKVLLEIDDWDFVGDDEAFFDSPLSSPRLVFGPPPTMEEAKAATSDLNDAISKANFFSRTIDMHVPEREPLHLDETEEEARRVTSAILPLMPKHVVQAFSLINESTEAQDVVASLASDPNVWDAVMSNPKVMNFYKNHQLASEAASNPVVFLAENDATKMASEAASNLEVFLAENDATKMASEAVSNLEVFLAENDAAKMASEAITNREVSWAENDVTKTASESVSNPDDSLAENTVTKMSGYSSNTAFQEETSTTQENVFAHFAENVKAHTLQMVNILSDFVRDILKTTEGNGKTNASQMVNNVSDFLHDIGKTSGDNVRANVSHMVNNLSGFVQDVRTSGGNVVDNLSGFVQDVKTSGVNVGANVGANVSRMVNNVSEFFQDAVGTSRGHSSMDMKTATAGRYMEVGLQSSFIALAIAAILVVLLRRG